MADRCWTDDETLCQEPGNEARIERRMCVTFPFVANFTLTDQSCSDHIMKPLDLPSPAFHSNNTPSRLFWVCDVFHIVTKTLDIGE